MRSSSYRLSRFGVATWLSCVLWPAIASAHVTVTAANEIDAVAAAPTAAETLRDLGSLTAAVGGVVRDVQVATSTGVARMKIKVTVRWPSMVDGESAGR